MLLGMSLCDTPGDRRGGALTQHEQGHFNHQHYKRNGEERREERGGKEDGGEGSRRRLRKAGELPPMFNFSKVTCDLGDRGHNEDMRRGRSSPGSMGQDSHQLRGRSSTINKCSGPFSFPGYKPALSQESHQEPHLYRIPHAAPMARVFTLSDYSSIHIISRAALKSYLSKERERSLWWIAILSMTLKYLLLEMQRLTVLHTSDLEVPAPWGVARGCP